MAKVKTETRVIEVVVEKSTDHILEGIFSY